MKFPHVEDGWRQKYLVDLDEIDLEADVALLTLRDPPAPAIPARITSAAANQISGPWSIWGYPVGNKIGEQDPGGYQVGGSVVAYSTNGMVELLEPVDHKVAVQGFSGTGVWSFDANAVVALVCTVKGDKVRAATMRTVVSCFPSKLQRISSQGVIGVDQTARSAWRIAEDASFVGHWDPRSRGVMERRQRGQRFSGRRSALKVIFTWLTNVSDRRIMIVTGSPGIGKSAVLARVVVTSDPVLRAQEPADELLAPEGSVSVAIHAKDKAPEEVARQIANAAFAEVPDELGGLAESIVASLERDPRPFTVLVDAVDESKEPHRMINQVLLPLTEVESEATIRVMAGSRRRDSNGDLLDEFGPKRHRIEVDLDDPRYFAFDDLVSYALLTLKQHGATSNDNAYREFDGSRQVAERIAQLADGNFLVAGLLAHTYGFYDITPTAARDIHFEPGNTPVRRALYQLLDRVLPVEGIRAVDLLTPLAYAEEPGLPIELWRVAVKALFGIDVPSGALERFVHGSAANFLVQTTSEPASFKLFHEALNETILEGR